MEEEDFLSHFGKKGMKWGKRKAITKTLSNAPLNAKLVKANLSSINPLAKQSTVGERIKGGVKGGLSKGGERVATVLAPRTMKRIGKIKTGVGIIKMGVALKSKVSGKGKSKVSGLLAERGKQLFHSRAVNNFAVYYAEKEAHGMESEGGNDYILEHFGVKGMKWGQRKRSRSGPTQTVYGKPASRLTDDQLNQRLNRLEKEQRYNRLNKAPLSENKKLRNEILTNAGRTLATGLVTAVGTYAIHQMLTGSHMEKMSKGNNKVGKMLAKSGGEVFDFFKPKKKK